MPFRIKTCVRCFHPGRPLNEMQHQNHPILSPALLLNDPFCLILQGLQQTGPLPEFGFQTCFLSTADS